MSIPVFSPSVIPSIGSSSNSSANILKADFGDGYSQRVGQGINNIGEQASLSWNNITGSQANTIVSFFEARGGFEAFQYTLPTESSAKKWTCDTWNKNYADGGLINLTCELTRVYDL